MYFHIQGLQDGRKRGACDGIYFADVVRAIIQE